jgi:excisionase family DNA binding protein
MSTTVESEFLTIAEAAAILKVDRSTIRRWIDRGDLPAYRVGQRAVRLRRDELDRMITPMRASGTETDELTKLKERKLTPEERDRALKAIEDARKLALEIYERRGRKLFSPSVEIIHEMRDERTEHLWEVVTGSRSDQTEQPS